MSLKLNNISSDMSRHRYFTKPIHWVLTVLHKIIYLFMSLFLFLINNKYPVLLYRYLTSILMVCKNKMDIFYK